MVGDLASGAGSAPRGVAQGRLGWLGSSSPGVLLVLGCSSTLGISDPLRERPWPAMPTLLEPPSEPHLGALPSGKPLKAGLVAGCPPQTAGEPCGLVWRPGLSSIWGPQALGAGCSQREEARTGLGSRGLGGCVSVIHSLDAGGPVPWMSGPGAGGALQWEVLTWLWGRLHLARLVQNEPPIRGSKQAPRGEEGAEARWCVPGGVAWEREEPVELCHWPAWLCSASELPEVRAGPGAVGTQGRGWPAMCF